MAPEQILGAWRDFGPWTDLYAVGVLVYELVTGMTPFPTLTGKPLMTAVVEQPVPAPTNTRFSVPPDFESWLARLLERNFLDRAQRAADVSLWLEQLGPARVSDSALPLADRVAQDTTRTVPVEGIDTGPIQIRTLLEGPAPTRLPRRPVPPDWRALETGSKPPPIRETERDRIWQALRQVDAGEGAHAVIVRGPSGSGRTSLGRWVLERAHELGAAWQLVATHQDPPRPLDGVGAMFATFLRSVDLGRDEVIERMRFLLQLREGTGLEHVVTEIMLPAGPDDEAAVRFESLLERNAASLAALQVLTGVLGGETDTAPLRNVVALIDDAHRGEEALGLVEMALGNRMGLPTPVLFVLTANDDGPFEARLQAIEAMDGALRIDLTELPDQVLRDRRPTPGVEVLRTEVGPPVPVDADALEHAIHATISGTATTGDDL